MVGEESTHFFNNHKEMQVPIKPLNKKGKRRIDQAVIPLPKCMKEYVPIKRTQSQISKRKARVVLSRRPNLNPWSRSNELQVFTVWYKQFGKRRTLSAIKKDDTIPPEIKDIVIMKNI